MLTDSAQSAPFTRTNTNAIGGDKVTGQWEWHRLRLQDTREPPPAHPNSSVLPAIGERRPGVMYPRAGVLQVRSGSKKVSFKS